MKPKPKAVAASANVNEGTTNLFTTRAKTDFFPPGFVRKPRYSAAMPAFSFAPAEKHSRLGGVFIKLAAPLSLVFLKIRLLVVAL